MLSTQSYIRMSRRRVGASHGCTLKAAERRLELALEAHRTEPMVGALHGRLRHRKRRPRLTC